MRREKTVVDVEVSEEQKAALLSQMVQQQRNLQTKITEQQRRQEEMVCHSLYTHLYVNCTTLAIRKEGNPFGEHLNL